MRINVSQFLLITVTVLLTASLALASPIDPGKQPVDYAVVGNNAQRLECISIELRKAFSEHVRCGAVYRKLASRSGKLRRQSARIHRQSRLMIRCRWDREINRLYDTLCEIQLLIADSRVCVTCPLDLAACDCVFQIDQLVAEAAVRIEQLYIATSCGTELINGPPVELQPAPGYLPVFERESFVPTPLTSVPRLELRRMAKPQTPTPAVADSSKNHPQTVVRPPVPNTMTSDESTPSVLQRR